MIVVDTSVWIDHLRHTEPKLVEMLESGQVLTHPFIIEELACGNLSNRTEFIELIGSLPTVMIAQHEEVLDLIEKEHLFGTGLGSVDVHLIASARLSFARIWSKDKALLRESRRLNIEANNY